jgi:hypothetical protein
MAALFQYRPHVHRDGKVFTPDLLVSHAYARIDNVDQPLPIDRLTTETSLQQVDRMAFGVAALVVIGGGDGRDEGPLLSVGSLHGAGADHLVCAKPVSRMAWRLADVATHLEKIVLRSWHIQGGAKTPATDEELTLDAGSLATAARETLTFHPASDSPPPAGDAEGFAVEGFVAELHDPVLGHTLTLAYSIDTLD